MKKITRLCLLVLLLVAGSIIVADAQYFGRNKPRYRSFDFEVLKTPHFELYHYLDNEEVVHGLADGCEKWYSMHQHIFRDTIFAKNPVIFYNNHADFQQTNAISGNIGVGTGGVTEALKNRVIMPLAMSNQQTDHVLGHEMVHAFQYSLVLNGDSTGLQNLANLPLWMVEGLAEYMSIGRRDAHTAMWMRDAVLSGDVPTLRQLDNYKYFPYRWGQVFWAFITGIKGDDIIKPLFDATAKYGFENACQVVLGMDSKELSELWVGTLKKHYGDFLGDRKERFVGKSIVSKENAGRMNISPALSPNGRYVIFYSEKDVFTLDLYLADARSGKIIRKLASTLRDGHIDDFSFIESAGTWSPNGKEFAFVGFSRGRNVLLIKNVEKGRTTREIFPKNLPAFSNPTWSPDGKSIVVAGLVEGQVDLYQIDVRSKRVSQLTNDAFAEMQPTWSRDGAKLAFTTDEQSIRKGRADGRWVFNLAVMDVANKTIEHLDIFDGADNLNPLFTREGDLVFLSDRDGFRNMYQYDFDSKKVYQMTDLLTGISGITQYAPAITIGGERDRVLFTHFYRGDYSIYEAELPEFLQKEVNPTEVDFGPALLPRVNKRAPDIVNEGLAKQDTIGGLTADERKEAKYRAKFRLDFVTGGGGVGVGTNSFGNNTLLAGGVTMLFSDVLGDQQLVTTLALNGEIYDAGGQVAYLNQKNRIGWGIGFTHIPYISFSRPSLDSALVDYGGQIIPAWKQHYKIQRLFENRFDVFAQYPFSVTQRVEAGVSYGRYGYRIDSIDTYYFTDPDYRFLGQVLGQNRKKLDDAPPGFNLYGLNAAYVGDNSYFGIASPLQGYRFRFGSEFYFGEYQFTSPTADFRTYKYLRPVSFAFRAQHIGRYGRDANAFSPIFLGYPWFVRGYQENFVNDHREANDLSIDQLLGSKILLSGVEVRLPFSGPERIAIIESGIFLTEFSVFLDGGVAWFDYDQFQGDVTDFFVENGQLVEKVIYRKAKPVFSTGVSLRVNLFGAIILEPYLSRPLQNETEWVFGLNIVPGW